MTYTISILRRAMREMEGLPDSAYREVRDAIRGLSQNPRPPGCRKLTGRDGWRLRVGDYRVLYDVDDDQLSITVLHVGHRRDVYR